MLATDYQIYQLVWNIVQTLFTFCLAIYLYYVNKDKARNQKIDELEKAILTKIDGNKTKNKAMLTKIDENNTENATRITTLEAKAEQRITHTDLAKVYETINLVRDNVKEIAGSLIGIQNQLKLLIAAHIKEEK